ncbi:hypothetical protein X801_02523, partial [Opisthorchis viverrini]
MVFELDTVGAVTVCSGKSWQAKLASAEKAKLYQAPARLRTYTGEEVKFLGPKNATVPYREPKTGKFSGGVNVLLTICGSATYRLIRSLVAPDLPNKNTFDDLVSIAFKHYKPKPSIIAQRFKFNTRVQKEGESIVLEVRSHTGQCDYKNFRNDMLRDRLVVGRRNARIQQCLLAHNRLVVGRRNARIQQCLLADSNLNLETIFDTAVVLEAAENNASSLQSVKPTVVSEVVDSSSEVNGIQHSSHRPQVLSLWGPSHSSEGISQTVCNRCKKRGHLMK